MSKKNSSQTSKIVKEYFDLLYMTPSIVTAKDISELLKKENYIKVELWEDMNVLELELANNNSIDFEPLDINFKDPSDAAFVKNRNIKTIFSIQLSKDDLETMKPFFENIVSQFNGFICADSDDFKPVYVGKATI